MHYVFHSCNADCNQQRSNDARNAFVCLECVKPYQPSLSIETKHNCINAQNETTRVAILTTVSPLNWPRRYIVHIMTSKYCKTKRSLALLPHFLGLPEERSS